MIWRVFWKWLKLWVISRWFFCVTWGLNLLCVSWNEHRIHIIHSNSLRCYGSRHINPPIPTVFTSKIAAGPKGSSEKMWQFILPPKDTLRSSDNGALCGGAVFETPSCVHNQCSSSSLIGRVAKLMAFWKPRIIKFPKMVVSPNHHLVGGLEHVFPCIGNFIIPTDELHHFSEGLVETTNQVLKAMVTWAIGDGTSTIFH